MDTRLRPPDRSNTQRFISPVEYSTGERSAEQCSRYSQPPSSSRSRMVIGDGWDAVVAPSRERGNWRGAKPHPLELVSEYVYVAQPRCSWAGRVGACAPAL